MSVVFPFYWSPVVPWIHVQFSCTCAVGTVLSAEVRFLLFLFNVHSSWNLSSRKLIYKAYPALTSHTLIMELLICCSVAKPCLTICENVYGTSHQFSSVTQVVSDSLRPHESQHARPPCLSPSPGVHSNSRPSSRWCHPAISSSVVPFSSCPQSLPSSESFPMSQLFAWGGQSTGVSALASFLPNNTQDWSPLDWTGWISLQSKGLSRVFSNLFH